MRQKCKHQLGYNLMQPTFVASDEIGIVSRCLARAVFNF